MKKTELQKIKERSARRAWWKHNKQDIFELAAVLVFGSLCWWFYCLVCYVYADVF